VIKFSPHLFLIKHSSNHKEQQRESALPPLFASSSAHITAKQEMNDGNENFSNHKSPSSEMMSTVNNDERMETKNDTEMSTSPLNNTTMTRIVNKRE
jgi:hypothetical protein